MELETIKSRIETLKAEIKAKQDDIDKIYLEKATLEQRVQSSQDEIQRLEQENFIKREEIKKYRTAVEIMEL